MHRSKSYQNLPTNQKKHNLSKSLPNLEIKEPEKRSTKRRNKLQKTWDKVKTIIHSSSSTATGGRRNSKIKDEPLKPSSSVPASPSKKLIFDFSQINYGQASRQGGQLSYDHGEQSTSVAGCSSKSYSNQSNDQIVRNYAKLQKRLSEELHASMKPEERDELTDEFKKRLHEWDMWKASTGKYHYTEDELRQLLPTDFTKKLQEWESIKSKTKIEPSLPGKKQRSTKKKTLQVNRQLTWLDKQLEKIENEKKRLEREMRKYCEREQRLEKMREILKNNLDMDGGWIKTPTAKCKIEGISNDFYKKLYKWEEKRGIQLESSTMVLLDKKYYNDDQNHMDGIVNDGLLVGYEDDDEHVEIEMKPEPSSTTTTRVDLCQNPKDYSSSTSPAESEDDYEEATDSFATKDESRASGASTNTDSDCFNLKPIYYRRRSSDAISTPLSAGSPSLSPGCTSDDEDNNYMLKTVNEEEDNKNEQQVVKVNTLRTMGTASKPCLRLESVKQIIVDEDMDLDYSNVFVPTKRTIFTPVVERAEENKLVKIENLTSPRLIKNIIDQIPSSQSGTPTVYQPNPISSIPTSSVDNQPGFSGYQSTNSWTEPKIVGVIRKCNDAQFPAFTPPSLSKQSKQGKIPVWCSPLISRRKIFAEQSAKTKFSSDFSIDKFLEESNLYPINTLVHRFESVKTEEPKSPSKIPISPYLARRKLEMEDKNIISLKRSCSFQGSGTTRPQVSLPQQQQFIGRPPIPPTSPNTDQKVTKSKSTGSILTNKNLFTHKLSINDNSTKNNEPRKIFPNWFRPSTSWKK